MDLYSIYFDGHWPGAVAIVFANSEINALAMFKCKLKQESPSLFEKQEWDYLDACICNITTEAENCCILLYGEY